MGRLASSTKPLHKIAILGAGGTNIGHHVLEALVKEPNFTVTVLARESSKSTFPPNVAVTRIADDFPHAALVEALQGQDVLISAVGPEAKKDAEYKLVEAAIEAGVRRFFPTEYGLDNSDPKNAAVSPIFGIKYDMQQHLKSKQKEGLTWTSVGTGMWIDWALAPGMDFTGIDIAAKTAAYWTPEDDSHTLSWSTLPFAAQGIIRALKHPKDTENKTVFIRAFEASQRQVVEELERQQGAKYATSIVDTEAIVQDSKTRLEADAGDLGAAFAGVQTAFLLPGYGTDFVKAGKYLVNDFAEMPKLTLEEAIKDVLKEY